MFIHHRILSSLCYFITNVIFIGMQSTKSYANTNDDGFIKQKKYESYKYKIGEYYSGEPIFKTVITVCACAFQDIYQISEYKIKKLKKEIKHVSLSQLLLLLHSYD